MHPVNIQTPATSVKFLGGPMVRSMRGHLLKVKDILLHFAFLLHKEGQNAYVAFLGSGDNTFHR